MQEMIHQLGWQLAVRMGHNCLACARMVAMEPAIIRDPEVMHGAPVFRGTRVPVRTLFEYLEGVEGLEDFLLGFPTVSRELAFRALEEAKHLLRRK